MIAKQSKLLPVSIFKLFRHSCSSEQVDIKPQSPHRSFETHAPRLTGIPQNSYPFVRNVG